MNVGELKANTLMALRKTKLADDHHKRVVYGNVVSDHGMEARRDAVRA